MHVQRDFRQGPDNATLLGRLAEYIRDCHAVICIIGKHCGACPPASAANHFPQVLPEGIKEASFTQWEFFLARHFGRRTYVYLAHDDYEPDKAAAEDDRADLQIAYRKFLAAAGVHYTDFTDAAKLRIAVLRDQPKIAGEPTPPNRPATKPIVLPYPSIGELFKGCDEFMRRLHESVTRARGGRTAITGQALYGLGGIGKSRVAVEYAWAHAEDHSALLFVVAETPEALRRNLAALAATLVPALDTTDDAVRLATVLDWLKANPGWFLILDNVDTAPALAELERLLRELAGGHVVVTSRLADFSGHFRALALDVLENAAAAAFILERTASLRRAAADDEAKAREIARELGGLALALEQAGAYIAKRRLSFTQYLQHWRANTGDILQWYDATVTDYPRAVAVTWQTSVAQLSEAGRRLLERLAWLAPEKVPESLLDVPIPGAEAEKLREAYDDLAAFSLVTRDAEGPFFLVHRLVQDVTRRSIAGDAQPHSLVQALGWIDAAFTGIPDDVRNWPRLDPLTPHAETVTAHADAAGIVAPTARLMNELGLLLYAKALHAEAEPLKRRVLAICEKSFGPNDPNVATALDNLAQLLMATNRLAEPEPLMRRALAIDEEGFGPHHTNVAVRLSNLAQLLEAADRLGEAEPLMRRALTIDETSHGPDHATVAIRLNNLAALLQATNRLEEAEPLTRRALAIDEKGFGPDHPKVAIRLNNLAALLQATNRLEEAEPLMRRVISILEKSFGSSHPNIATALNNLAYLLQTTRRLVEAEPLMCQVINILVEFTRRTGHRHPYLDVVFANYSNLLADMGKEKVEIDAACVELMRPLEGHE